MAIKAEDREPKRAPLNMRTTQALRDRLAIEAAKNDRSLAQEVEARLEGSFQTESLRLILREELRAELRAELRSEIRLAMAEYTVEIGEEDGDEARH